MVLIEFKILPTLRSFTFSLSKKVILVIQVLKLYDISDIPAALPSIVVRVARFYKGQRINIEL